MRRAVLILGCGLLGACDGEGEASCGEPTYMGEATDEVWRTMLDGEPRATPGDADGPVLSEPADGAEVAASGRALRIAWSSPIAHAEPLAPEGRGVGVRRPEPLSPVWGRGVGVRGLSPVTALFEGTAWAHLPPVTGDVYWARLTVPGRACAVEAVSTELEWTLSGEDWDAVRAAAGQAIRIDLSSAYVNENRITEGPYRAASRTVSIVP